MENLPLADNSLDALVCVYCFHEMPEAARVAAAKEWFRCVFCGGGGDICCLARQTAERPAQMPRDTCRHGGEAYLRLQLQLQKESKAATSKCTVHRSSRSSARRRGPPRPELALRTLRRQRIGGAAASCVIRESDTATILLLHCRVVKPGGLVVLTDSVQVRHKCVCVWR